MRESTPFQPPVLGTWPEAQRAWLGAAEYARQQALLRPNGEPAPAPRETPDRRRTPRPLHKAPLPG
jgi:hypothetical protein